MEILPGFSPLKLDFLYESQITGVLDIFFKMFPQ